MSLGSKTVLAVDPGTSKCGLALVRRNPGGDIELLWHTIAKVEGFCDALEEAAQQAEFSMVIVGSGTASRNFVELLRESMPSVGILVVDERDTTMQARERYWERNPRKGWRRLLPATMWVPPVPIDDYAAFVLAERVLTE